MLDAILLAYTLTQEPEPPDVPACLYVHSLEQPAVSMPCEMAVRAGEIAWCESRFDATAIGASGERGSFQIHPVHFPAMRALGLDPTQERDLVGYAGVLWERTRSFSAWSCGR